MNLACDRKFRDFLGSGRALGRLSDTLCVENGLSIIEKPQHTTLTYDKWLGDRAKQPQREKKRATIDEIMRQKPENFDALLSVLREKGWEIKHGKRMSARAPGQIRFKRLDLLGEEYSEKTLRAALDEKREWQPKERRKGQKPKIEHTRNAERTVEEDRWLQELTVSRNGSRAAKNNMPSLEERRETF